MKINIVHKISLTLFALTCLIPSDASASLVQTKWYFGNWNNCLIDGRPAKMQWKVVDDPQTSCDGNVCSSSSGVKVVGRFSDNGGAWVPLKVQSSPGNDLRIRYQGAEPDNWFLRYSPTKKSASGWTTWRGNRYPLSCSK